MTRKGACYTAKVPEAYDKLLGMGMMPSDVYEQTLARQTVFVQQLAAVAMAYESDVLDKNAGEQFCPGPESACDTDHGVARQSTGS